MEEVRFESDCTHVPSMEEVSYLINILRIASVSSGSDCQKAEDGDGAVLE